MGLKCQAAHDTRPTCHPAIRRPIPHPR